MPPQKSSKDSQKSIEDLQQPLWAKKMEDTIMDRLKEVTDALSFNDGRLNDLEKKIDDRCQELDRRLEDFEYHQRKYNILIFGLKIQQDNCEEMVREFFGRDLEIGETATKMPFHHCHPLPARSRPDGGATTSACIVRFVSFKDKESVLKALPKLKGKNKKITVRTDLPKRLRAKRADLQQKMKDLKKDNAARVFRIVERNQDVFLEEKKNGNKWSECA